MKETTKGKNYLTYSHFHKRTGIKYAILRFVEKHKKLRGCFVEYKEGKL